MEGRGVARNAEGKVVFVEGAPLGVERIDAQLHFQSDRNSRQCGSLRFSSVLLTSASSDW